MADREISVSAEIALAQASCNPQPDRGIAPGCTLARTLKPGDEYLRPGRHVCDSEGNAVAVNGNVVIEMHRVTVVSGPHRDTTSDPFGRTMMRFRIRSNRLGHEGNVIFGARGIVRVEPSPNFVLYEDLHPEAAA